MASEAGNGGPEYTPEEEQVARDVVTALIASEKYAKAAHTYMGSEIEESDWDNPVVKELWSTLGDLCVVAIGISRRYGLILKDDDDG